MKIRNKLYKQFIKSKNNQTRNIHGLDKYNTMFQNVKRVLLKLILKFHKDCNFAGQSLIYTFIFPVIFLLLFLVNLRIALYQQGLIDSYQL